MSPKKSERKGKASVKASKPGKTKQKKDNQKIQVDSESKDSGVIDDKADLKEKSELKGVSKISKSLAKRRKNREKRKKQKAKQKLKLAAAKESSENKGGVAMD